MRPEYIDRKALLAELNRLKVPYFAAVNEIILSMPTTEILYLCDRRDDCKHCSWSADPGCHATYNVRHAVGFYKDQFGVYIDERLKEYGYDEYG